MRPDECFWQQEETMNRMIPLLTILLLTLCQVRAQEKTHRDQWRLRGPVRSLSVEKITLAEDGKQQDSTELLDEVSFDERGNLTFQEAYHPGLSRRYANNFVHTYDAQSRITKTTVYEADGSRNRYELFSYDEQGRKIKTEWRRGKDQTFSETLYLYNSRGLLAHEQSRFLNLHWRQSRTDYTYDEKGRRVKTAYFPEDASRSTRTTYEYNESANPGITTVYDAEENIIVRWNYRYDAQGREMEVYVYGPDAALKWHSTMAYESDSHGNWIKLKITREVFENGQPRIEHQLHRRKITYHQTLK